MTPESFAARFDVPRETLASLLAYVALLEKWQHRINLVSSATLPDIWRRHILDSAQLIPHLPLVPARQRLHILDIGSGAGFPGLVLAILGVGHVQLVESNQRKAVFLQTVIRELGVSFTGTFEVEVMVEVEVIEVGKSVGSTLGKKLGDSLGNTVGSFVGSKLGNLLGILVGLLLGKLVGIFVG